jgi:hypothetical protein
MITWNDLPIMVIGIVIGKFLFEVVEGIVKGIQDFIREQKWAKMKKAEMGEYY